MGKKELVVKFFVYWIVGTGLFFWSSVFDSVSSRSATSVEARDVTWVYRDSSSADNILVRQMERLVEGIGDVDEMKKTVKAVMKVVDSAMMSACLAFVLVFSFMVAGASASRLAIGEQEA